MPLLRAFLLTHRRLAALLLALALCMKVALPAGTMIGDAKVFTIQICADASGARLTKQIVVPHSGDEDGTGKSAGDCPYAGLAMPGLAGADTPLLALALAFILALGFAPVRPATSRRIPHVRPPLRGPPALA